MVKEVKTIHECNHELIGTNIRSQVNLLLDKLYECPSPLRNRSWINAPAGAGPKNPILAGTNQRS